MKNVISAFWRNLLQKLGDKINKYLNGDTSDNAMTASDKSKINFFLMVLKCVLNRTLTECSFDVISDSEQAEPMKKAVKDINDNAYKIGAMMLGGGSLQNNKSECWAVLVDKKHGKHHFMNGDEICITAKTGDMITDCFMIWSVTKRRNTTYLLCRQHTLDSDGTLRIRFFAADETANEVNIDIPEWDDFLYLFDDEGVKRRKEIVIPGAEHIGFGRYKSPVLCMDDDTYGKPLNYGCGKIEAEIENTLRLIQLEYKATTTKIFADESIVRKKDKDGKPLEAYTLDEYIYLMKSQLVDGKETNLLQCVSPEIRSSAYFSLLVQQLEQYQALMGVQELVTHERTTNGATATEIKNTNLNNMALEKSVQAAMTKGNIETLTADSLYYGIRPDLWDYDETWNDIYEDEQQTLQNYITLYEAGALPLEDLLKYWNPKLGDEAIAEKAERIRAEKAAGSTDSIEQLLAG